MKFKIIINTEAEEEIVATVKSPSLLTEKIEDLIRNYNGSDSILGYSNGDLRKLIFCDIECITVVDRRTIAIDKDGNNYVIKERLRDIEKILPSYFIRINKSSLANKNRILQFKAVYNCGIDAEFMCGFREYVSRRCFSEIKKEICKK